MKKAIPAIILGTISLATGFMGYGGYIFGISALILGILAARETGTPRVIGLIAIIFGCIGIVVKSLEKAIEPLEKATEPHEPHPTPPYNIAGTEVAVKNWGITVTPPSYTGILYKRTAFANEYIVYKPRSGYHFALVKIKTINHGKEEDEPDLHDIKLVTTEGLRYRQKSTFNDSYIEFEKPPTPLFNEFSTYESVLPREKAEGYFYFQIPVNAVPESLFFNYGMMRRYNSIAAAEVRIKLRPKIG